MIIGSATGVPRPHLLQLPQGCMDSSVRRLDRSELRLQKFSNRFEPADATPRL